jgi:hypothetical protein
MSANDVEMSRPRGGRTDDLPEDTEYKPIDWKKLFLSPKYIRMHTPIHGPQQKAWQGTF